MKVAAVLASFLVSVIFAEVAARTFDLAPREVPWWRTNPRASVMQHDGEDFRATYTTNIHGLRGPEIGLKTGKRIVVVGDSYTFGWGVNEREDYPSILAELTKAEVINFGVPGTNPFNFYNYVSNYVATLKPDTVLVSLFEVRNTYLGGDIESSGGVNAYLSGTRSSAERKIDPDAAMRDNYLWRSALVRLAWRAAHGIDWRLHGVDWPGPTNTVVTTLTGSSDTMRPNPSEIDRMRDALMLDPATRDIRARELEATVKLLAMMRDRISAPFVILIFPVGWQVTDYITGADVAHSDNLTQHILALCKREELTCISGRDRMREFASGRNRSEIFFRDTHFTAATNAIFAAIATQALTSDMISR